MKKKTWTVFTFRFHPTYMYLVNPCTNDQDLYFKLKLWHDSFIWNVWVQKRLNLWQLNIISYTESIKAPHLIIPKNIAAYKYLLSQPCRRTSFCWAARGISDILLTDLFLQSFNIRMSFFNNTSPVLFCLTWLIPCKVKGS